MLVLLQEGTLVKTDGIINSLPKLIDTRRVLVRHFNGAERIKVAPERSFFGKLAKKKTIVLGNKITPDQMNQMRQSMIFQIYIGNAVGVLFNLSLLAAHAQLMGLVAFVKMDTGFFETLNVIYMRESLDESRKQFTTQRLCSTLFDQRVMQ